MLNFYLFIVQGLPQPQQKTDRANIHVGEYIIHRKVCVETTRASRTLRRVYTTPRDSHPCNVFVCCSIVEVLNDQKQSVSNAFPICSAPPCSSAHLNMHHSHHGQIAGTKVQILFVNAHP